LCCGIPIGHVYQAQKQIEEKEIEAEGKGWNSAVNRKRCALPSLS
jgi:hypothetical protein